MSEFTSPEQTDLKSLSERGESALGELFARIKPDLSRMVRLRVNRRLLRRLDGSDIIQEAFLESRRRLSEYLAQPALPPLPWIRRLVRQVIARCKRDHLGTQCRDARRETYATYAQIDVEEFSDVFTPPSAKVERSENKQRVLGIVDDMSATEREIICLVHFENRTVREAAQELNISLEAAKKRYRRALNRLKEIFDENSSPPIPLPSPPLPASAAVVSPR